MRLHCALSLEWDPKFGNFIWLQLILGQKPCLCRVSDMKFHYRNSSSFHLYICNVGSCQKVFSLSPDCHLAILRSNCAAYETESIFSLVVLVVGLCKLLFGKKMSRYYSFMANYVQYLARRRFFYTDKSQNGKRYLFVNVKKNCICCVKMFWHSVGVNLIKTNLQTCNLWTG